MLLSDAFVFRRFDQFFSADDFIQPFECVIYIGGGRILLLSVQETANDSVSAISAHAIVPIILCIAR